MPTPEPENGERRLRVLVVDDHDVVHWGFRLLLTQQSWVERCLSARTEAEAIGHTRRFEPHVALVDLFVGDESGAEICEQLRAQKPAPKVLLISRAGRMVGLGRTVFPPQTDRTTFELSEREREVLDLMASGATNREIAGSLFLSPNTVKEHTSGLFRKLDVRNRTEA